MGLSHGIKDYNEKKLDIKEVPQWGLESESSDQILKGKK